MILLLTALGCQGAAGREAVSRPAAASVAVNMPTFAAVTPEDLPALERHLRSSLRWEIREEPAGNGYKRLAVRREQGPPGSPEMPATPYASTLNGYYSNFNSKDVVQTRVIVGLGQEYGYGSTELGVTRAPATAGPVQLALVDNDQPGAWSVLIVQGGAGLTLEIYEQAWPEARAFTQRTLDEVEAELSAALARKDELLSKGYLADLVPEGSVSAGPPSLLAEDGMQPGIFQLSGWANPGEPGTVWVRAFYEGAAQHGPLRIPPELIGHEDDELSAGRLRQASARQIGWSADPSVLFRYKAEGTVYEGDWEHLYRARFELWFQPEHGEARVLAGVERDISGWQR